MREGLTDRCAPIRLDGMEMIICSEVMRKLMAMVERVARGNAAILITGETGSGKELIARAIHSHSLRCNKPWVDLNCAALPDHLVESELFGYEKGAFSGADTAKPGLFELADKGTLFLDEIGELEARTQVKLLRVLDGVPYYRLGGARKVGVDVRIVAATNRSLDEAVKNGQFRSDLFHRLSQIQLRVPPLRDRPEDVVALAHYFLTQLQPNKSFSTAALERLRSYGWPGNIRELRNVVLQACVAADDSDEIRPFDLPEHVGLGQVAHSDSPVAEQKSLALDDMEKQAILRALARADGHQGLAAEQLGISRRTLSRKLKQYSLGAQPSAPESLGILSGHERLRFRATVDMPVSIFTNTAQYDAKALNVSAGGLAVEGIRKPFQLSEAFKVRFALPETTEMFELQAQVVWADRQGKAGVRFLELPADRKDFLMRWLNQKQMAEGWTVFEA